MLPLMAMILQAGILSRQNDMLQRQNDLISEIQTRLNERDEKLSAPDAAHMALAIHRYSDSDTRTTQGEAQPTGRRGMDGLVPFL